VRVKNYEAGNAPQIVRLFYETVRPVSRTYYSGEQMAAWAKNIPDPIE
jgi:hypothetical protein